MCMYHVENFISLKLIMKIKSILHFIQHYNNQLLYGTVEMNKKRLSRLKQLILKSGRNERV